MPYPLSPITGRWPLLTNKIRPPTLLIQSTNSAGSSGNNLRRARSFSNIQVGIQQAPSPSMDRPPPLSAHPVPSGPAFSSNEAPSPGGDVGGSRGPWGGFPSPLSSPGAQRGPPGRPSRRYRIPSMDRPPLLPQHEQETPQKGQESSTLRPPILEIPNLGLIQGQVDKDHQVVRFLNVPFAKVKERWQKAQPVSPWEGVKDATRVGPLCPQPFVKTESVMSTLFGIPALDSKYPLEVSEEDCLHLNIYAPLEVLREEKKDGGGGGSKKLLPVICYIHGGRYRNGGNSLPIYDFTNFVQKSVEMGKGVIVVSINYRLGHLGFLSSKELIRDERERHLQSSLPKAATRDSPQEFPSPAPLARDECFGNWGLGDQAAGMRWVRENIHVFGGDANKMTGMGHSCGSSSVAYHMLIPSHRGLFQRAILHSAAANTMRTKFAHEEGQRWFNHLSTQLEQRNQQKLQDQASPPLSSQDQEKDVKTSWRDRLALMKAVPAQELVQLPDIPGSDRVTYPLLSKHHSLFTSHSSRMISNSDLYDPGLVSVIIGQNKNEGTIFTNSVGACKVETWPHMLTRLFAPVYQDEAHTFYERPETDQRVKEKSARVFEDMYMGYPIYQTCKALLRGRLPATGNGSGANGQGGRGENNHKGDNTGHFMMGSTTNALQGDLHLLHHEPSQHPQQQQHRHHHDSTCQEHIQHLHQDPVLPQPLPNLHCFVNRYYFEATLEAVDKLGKGLGSHHSAEMAYTLMSDECQKYMSPAERTFGYELVSKWIDFASGDDHVLTERGQQGLEATVFTEQKTIEKTHFERLDEKTIAFMDRNEEWFATQELQDMEEDSADVGIMTNSGTSPGSVDHPKEGPLPIPKPRL